MASLHSMEIRGIRSFGTDADDEERIKFLSPITCIVGQNGCGKTTIIESLRYAATGAPPPGTDKGKSFVYDPKLTSSGQSLGQVKLRFNTTKKTIMQVKRSLKCTLKRDGKIEMKSVEPTLEFKDKYDQNQAISGRCQDINTMVMDNLGVSQAILDNVIFCHQDDSNWPLDEAKKLKDKFDDIFDASKYNKATDAITKLIKGRAADLKLAQANLTHHMNYWEMAKKKKSDLEREERRFQENADKIKELGDEKKPLQTELNKIHQRESDYSELSAEISTLEKSVSNLKDQQVHLKRQIKTEHKGSKSDLEEEIQNFDADVKVKDREIKNLEEKIGKLNIEDKSVSNRIQKEQVELGKLTQEEKSHQETLKKRFDLLKTICKELGKDCLLEDPKDKRGSEKALASIEKGVQEFESNLKSTSKEQDQVEQSLESDIYKYRDELSKATGKVAQLKVQLDETKKTLKISSDEVRKVDSGLSKVSILQSRLDRVEKELKAEEDALNVDESQREIRDTQGSRKDFEDENEVIAKEINVLQLAKGLTAEADVYKKSIEEKKECVDSLMAKHKKSLKELFSDIPENKLKIAVDDLTKKYERERDQLQKQLQGAKNSRFSNDTELNHLNKLLHEAEAKVKDEVKRIKMECGDLTLDSVLRDTEAELTQAQDQKGILDSSGVLFKKYVSQLSKDDPCCPLCHRDFDEKKETVKLIAELNLKIKDYPKQISNCAETQKKLQSKQSRLQQLIPAQKKVEDLQTDEIPKLRDQIEELEMSMQVSVAEESNATEKLHVPESKLKIAELVKSDMAIVDKYQDELKNLESKLSKVEADLPTSGARRSLEEAQADQERVRVEIQRLQKIAEDKQNALNNHQQKVNQLKDRKNSLNSELLEIKSGEQKKTQLLDQVKQLTEKEKQLSSELYEAKETIVPIKESLARADDEKNRAKSSHNEIKEKQQRQLANYRGKLSNLKDMVKLVENFESRNLSFKFEELKANVEKLAREKEEVDLKKEEVGKKMTVLQKELVSQNVRQRELHDNLRLMELRAESLENDKKIKKLKDELGDLNYVDMMEKKTKLNSRILKIMGEVSRLDGSQQELRDKIRELKQELNKDTFKNAEPKYKKLNVEILVEERIIKDLKTYWMALNKSVMLFHKERMEEVNRIIRELWVSIYKGSDIDHIEIKTEADDKQTDTLRRNYNYRVVMVKKNRELDMRGRCSAGQKMLASLVIRIALSETFSSSCGILALDEPTTNLDTSNIDSLCNALIELAQSHHLQKNFQLLIITHDEDFIEKMTQAQLIDSFFRVSRNAQGHSKIKKFRVDGNEEK